MHERLTNINGALFDLDGVLIDTETLYTGFWQKIEQIYPTGIPDYALAIKGTTLTTILSRYTPEVADDIRQRLQQFQDTMPFPLLPGALDFLENLRCRNIPTALYTSSDPRKLQLLRLQQPQLLSYFHTIIDGSMVSHSKPHPEGYILAARRIGRHPDECAVFEDSLQGLRAARASGALVVGIATTYPAERISPMADITVHTLADLL